MVYTIRYMDYNGEVVFTYCESEKELSKIEDYCLDLDLLYHVYKLIELY